MPDFLFISGVPCTGKTWLGKWLADHKGYIHIDAERNGGSDFDQVDAHAEWDQLFRTGYAEQFFDRLRRAGRPVVLNWGMRMEHLFVVAALEDAGFEPWWLRADRLPARKAFLARGGIDPRCFDEQMNGIERYSSLLSRVFGKRVIEGLSPEGLQRKPEDLWKEIYSRR